MKLTTLNQIAPWTDDFFFHTMDDITQRDAIVVHNPQAAISAGPVVLRSKKSLDEHIRYIQENKIKKALVIAEDIRFLRQCPSLEYLWIIPAFSARNFDYSPLYDLPCVKWLQCETIYGIHEDQIAHVDYSRIHGLRRLSVAEIKGHHQLCSVSGLQRLSLWSGQPGTSTLVGAFDGAALETLTLGESSLLSLDGIEQACQLQGLRLFYNRKLSDISALRALKESLIWLEIDSCGKITDFSALSELHNLEVLSLRGSNTLPDISFLQNMPKLTTLYLRMNVADGDLQMCTKIPYVAIKNRKHYSHKDSDFSKISVPSPQLFKLH